MLSLEFPPVVGLKFCFVFVSTESPLGVSSRPKGVTKNEEPSRLEAMVINVIPV